MYDDESMSQIEDIWCCIDTEKISQVLRNLLSNSFQFTQRHGQISINTTYRVVKTLLNNDSRGVLRIEIKDNGIGIAEVCCCYFTKLQTNMQVTA
jgi:signal transduction histidine kinase